MVGWVEGDDLMRDKEAATLDPGYRTMTQCCTCQERVKPGSKRAVGYQSVAFVLTVPKQTTYKYKTNISD